MQSARGPIKTASSHTHRGKKAEKADGTGFSSMFVHIEVKKREHILVYYTILLTNYEQSISL